MIYRYKIYSGIICGINEAAWRHTGLTTEVAPHMPPLHGRTIEGNNESSNNKADNNK